MKRDAPTRHLRADISLTREQVGEWDGTWETTAQTLVEDVLLDGPIRLSVTVDSGIGPLTVGGTATCVTEGPDGPLVVFNGNREVALRDTTNIAVDPA